MAQAKKGIKGIRRLVEMVRFQREVMRVLCDWNAGLMDGEAAMTEISMCEAWCVFKLQTSNPDYESLPSNLNPAAELVFED